MKAYILASGNSVRWKGRPKCALWINGAPVIVHNIGLLRRAGIRDIVVSVREKDKRGFGRFLQKLGIEVCLISKSRGTAGDLKDMARKEIEPFIVLYGDNYSNIPIRTFTDSYTGCIASICVFDKTINRNSDLHGSSVMSVDCGLIGFEEGCRGSNFVNAGLYVCHPNIMTYIPDKGIVDFGKHVFPTLLKEDLYVGVYRVPPNVFVFGLDTPAVYRKVKHPHHQ